MAISGGRIISSLELDTGRYTASMAAAHAQAQRFAADGSTIGTKIQSSLGVLGNIGNLLTAGVTLPVVGAAAASAKFAIGFEAAFAGVKKTVDATAGQFAQLEDAILKMGRVVPRAHEELAGIMQTAGQLGVPQQQLEKFTRTIADLDVATNLTGEAGASMLAQYANVKQMPLNDIDRLGSVIVDLGNNTATTEADIVAMAQRLSGAAAVLKLTDAQTMGLSATMSSLGINAEAGGSAMSRVMQRIQRDVMQGSASLDSYAKTAGMSKQAFVQAFGADPLQAISAFIDGLAAINDAGGDVYQVLDDVELKDLRVTDTLLRMAGAQGQLQKNIERANKAWSENTALTKEAEQFYNTTESKIKRAQNSIKEAGIDIGQAFLPTIADAAQGVAGLANAFSDMDDKTQKTIVTGAGIVAGIGPAMLLTKGLIGLLTGPGGLVAGLGLAAVAVAGLSALSHEMTLAGLRDEMGDIELSADEIKKIVAVGFGAPMIDFSKLTAAREEADQALTSFQELQAQLEKDVYLAKMGVTSLTQQEVEQKVGALVGQANSFLAAEENAAKMTVKAYFGPGSAEGESMLGDLAGALDPMKAELSAKGKELGDALKGAIADGKIDAEEQKVITNLQNEIAEITTRGALMKSQAERDVMIAEMQHKGLSVDSIREGSQWLEGYGKTLLGDYETEKKLMLTIASNLKSLGTYSEAEYDQKVEEIFARYGNMQADVDMAKLDTAWEMFGRQVTDVFAGKLKKAQDILNMPGFDLNNTWDQENNANRDMINEASRQAEAMMKELGGVYKSLQDMQGKLGDEMPAQYRQMLAVFEQLDALAKLDIPQIKELDITDSTKVDQAIQKSQEAKQKVESALDGSAEVVKQKGAEAGAAAIEGANEGALATESRVLNAATAPIQPMPGAFGKIGAQAASDLASAMAKGAGAVFGASETVAKAGVAGLKRGYGIASPSKEMYYVVDNLTASVEKRMQHNGATVARAHARLAKTGVEATRQGYAEAVASGRDYRALTPSAGGPFAGYQGSIARLQSQRQVSPSGSAAKASKGGGGSAAAPVTVPDFSAQIAQTLARADSERAKLQQLTAQFDKERQNLLAISGDWRSYYDKTVLDTQVEAIQNKYKKLIAAEQAGFDALSNEERQARSQAHAKLMQQIQQNQQEELSRVRENHDLQRRLATDFLNAQSSALQEAFNKKQEAARAEDYDKTVADLEKRIRQSRSARERRELTEELDRLKRDEGLRLEQLALQQAMQGFGALKAAVAAGVIGLGDLTGDRNLPASAFGAGLKHVQGATSQQLEKALMALADSSQRQTGNHYTIDLSGAVIRDDQDIDRIVAAFEEKNRSIQRDMNVWR